MKTKLNLRNPARMMMSLLAAFLLTPAFSDTLSDSANAEIENAYSNLEKLQNNFVHDLEYRAPDALSMEQMAALVEVYEELSIFNNKAEDMIRYTAPVEDSNLAAYKGSNEAYEKITELAGVIEISISYNAPKLEPGFQYQFEMAKAEESLGHSTELMAKSLAYHATAADPGFVYDPVLAMAREEIENQAVATARELTYKAPVESHNVFSYDFETALIMEQIERNAKTASDDVSYEAPMPEPGFAYSYEMALAEERLEDLQALTLKMLQYSAPDNLEVPFEFAGSFADNVTRNAAGNMHAIVTIKRSPSVAIIKASY